MTTVARTRVLIVATVIIIIIIIIEITTMITRRHRIGEAIVMEVLHFEDSLNRRLSINSLV